MEQGEGGEREGRSLLTKLNNYVNIYIQYSVKCHKEVDNTLLGFI